MIETFLVPARLASWRGHPESMQPCIQRKFTRFVTNYPVFHLGKDLLLLAAAINMVTYWKWIFRNNNLFLISTDRAR